VNEEDLALVGSQHHSWVGGGGEGGGLSQLFGSLQRKF